MAAKLESAGRGRMASGGMDLVKEMRTLQKNVADFVMSEHTRVQGQIGEKLFDHKFLPKDVWIQKDHGWLNVVGTFTDNADLWRTQYEVGDLFQEMFDTSVQLSGSAPNWKFSMGGVQSY